MSKSNASSQLVTTHKGSQHNKGDSKSIYYSLNAIERLCAIYNVIIGKRSNGKTYACLEKIIRDYAETGKQGAYLRRYREDFRGKRGDQLFAAHVSNGLISEVTNGEWNSVKYYAGRWYFSKFDSVLNKDVRDNEPFCFGFSLSEMEHDKSTSYPDIVTIVFDEFITRQYYLPDEFVLFMNVLSTIIRGRFDVTIYMLGNTVNKYCPYFKEMGLRHVDEMELGTIDLYKYGDSELTVAVERCDDPESSKKSNKYFTFDNPSLQMITGGAWEIDIYPHLPMKYVKRDILLIYFIMFNDYILQCEIVVKDDCIFTYIHRKTTEIQNPDEDIVFTTDYSPRPNFSRNILKPSYEVHRKISNFFKAEKVFYQDNEVGELVRNYLLWCKNTAGQ
ncbi:MAG: phage DNA encapsidation protein [Paludibacteraceae bacterium]|nr:phage DNA encapsidation protein [Paludibacteraceae bacterium]